MIKQLINRLSDRFKWTIHNVIAHPLSEVLYQAGFEKIANDIHDATVPTHSDGIGRG